MPLNPFQSRRAVSIAATLIVSTIYTPLFAPQLVWATDSQFDVANGFADNDVDLDATPLYDADFPLFGKDILGRAGTGDDTLGNNEPKSWGLQPGSTRCYRVEKGTVFGKRALDSTKNPAFDSYEQLADPDATDTHLLLTRDDTERTVYISASTCLQPKYHGSDLEKAGPPQLALYFSNSSDTGCADPTNADSAAEKQEFDGGAVMYTANVTGDFFITVAAPDVSKDFDGMYNFEISMSVDDYYHSYDNETTELLWLDSDSSSALLSSQNLTDDREDVQRILDRDLPFELFVYKNNDAYMHELRNSGCGLQQNANISAKKLDDGRWNDQIRTKMTTNGPGKWPKQQFYVPDLNSTTSYFGVLVSTGNVSDIETRQESTKTSRGTVVFAGTKFDTLSGTNCRIITDLDFCTEVQYAVPGNDKLNGTELAKAYDDYAREMYENFEKVMMQVQCETTSTQKYSLVKTCDDCRQAYKRWLCTVSMPRCEDIMSGNAYSIMRNIGQPFPNGTRIDLGMISQDGTDPALNVSRNKFIDTNIKPGPYKEILPCDDVCYEVVQSCPAKIGFTCPRPKMYGFATSYGQRDDDSPDVTCNFPGEARTRPSAGSVAQGSVIMAALPVLMMVMIF